MSKTTKRKHVLREVLYDYGLPKENQTIVRVLSSKGNNLHQVESNRGEVYLVSMPTKFRRNIWMKRGDFILVEPILEGDKVKGEIIKILDADSIKHYKENNIWPKEFESSKRKEENDDDLFVNPNRVSANTYIDTSDSDADSSDSEESDDGTNDT